MRFLDESVTRLYVCFCFVFCHSLQLRAPHMFDWLSSVLRPHCLVDRPLRSRLADKL